MNDPTIKFLTFALFSAAALTVGYLARKRNLMHEDRSRPIHFYTLVVLWAPVSLFSFWRLTPNRDLLIIMLLQPLLMSFGWFATVQLSRLFRLPRVDAGVMVLSAAMSNQGFTLGAYLCYSLLKPGDLAMSYAIAFVTSMQVFMVLIFYPVAQHYAHLAAQTARTDGATDPLPSMTKLIVSSFIDWRAMPLYAAVLGLLLHAGGVAFPTQLTRAGLLDVLFFVGAATSYFGIGLRLRLGDSRQYVRHHIVLAIVKFIAMPGLAVLCWLTLGWVNLPLSSLPAKVLIYDSFASTAIASVILANLFHLDARMASVLWLWNTLLFMLIPMPLLLIFAR